MATYPPFKWNQLAGLCRRVGVALEAGVDARKVWSREAERASGRQRRALQVIADQMQQGTTLPDALRETGEAFPPLMHDMIRIGNDTGNLDQVCLHLGEHFEHLHSLKRTMLRGLILPVIQLGIAALSVAVLIYVSKGISEGLEVSIYPIGFGLQGASGVWTFFTAVLVIVVVCAFLIENWRHGRWGGPKIFGMLYRVPVLGNCLQTLSLGRMAWTLSLTTNTPMSVLRAVKLALRSTASLIYTRCTDQVIADLKDGHPIHVALRNTGEFPDEFVDVVEVGEETGMLSESLARLSAQYEERAQSAAKMLTMIGSFLVWAGVALLVIVLVIRLVMAYSGMITEMTSPDYMR